MGQEEATIGFKSARKKMAFGIGKMGSAMSEAHCYEKLRSLQTKGCLKILDSTRSGTRLQLKLPSEIAGVVPVPVLLDPRDLGKVDFFSDATARLALLKREGGKCFYCFRELSSSNYVIEHVESRPEGDNTYRNLVASCRSCNNRKGDTPAPEFLRILYGAGQLNPEELEDRLMALRRLKNGGLIPRWPIP